MRLSPITIEAARRQRAGARALWSRTAVAGLRRPPSAGCAAHDAGHRSHSLRRVRAGRHRLYLVAERPAAGDGLAAPRREWTCAGARPPSAQCFSNRPLSPGLRPVSRVADDKEEAHRANAVQPKHIAPSSPVTRCGLPSSRERRVPDGILPPGHRSADPGAHCRTPGRRKRQQSLQATASSSP